MHFENLKEVVIFGAGSLLNDTIKYFKDRNASIIGIVDNNSKIHGTSVEGILISNPSTLAGTSIPVIIASMYSSEIAQQLKNIGVREFYDFSFLFDLHRWKDHFNRDLMKDSNEKINSVYDLLSDQRSKDVFSSILEYRKSFDPSGLQSAGYPDYFHPEVSPHPSDTIIDGGAWHGDSALEFVSKLGSGCKIFSFEPEDENYQRLQKNIADHNLKGTVDAIKLGLWSDKMKLHFFQSADFDMQFRIDPTGTSDISIDVVSIDEFLSENNVRADFIKMDIEGSEIPALVGASKTLKEHKPRLAICAYHQHDDLWEIPLLIKAINPNYKLYMGHHSQNLFETVLYAH